LTRVSIVGLHIALELCGRIVAIDDAHRVAWNIREAGVYYQRHGPACNG